MGGCGGPWAAREARETCPVIAVTVPAHPRPPPCAEDHNANEQRYQTASTECSSKLTNTNQTIDQLEQEVVSQTGIIADKNTALAAKNTAIEHKHEQISTTEGSIEETIAALNSGNQSREAAHADYQDSLSAHRKALDAVAEIKAELKKSDLYNSTQQEEESTEETNEEGSTGGLNTVEGGDTTDTGDEGGPALAFAEMSERLSNARASSGKVNAFLQVASEMASHMETDGALPCGHEHWAEGPITSPHLSLPLLARAEDVVALMKLLKRLHSTLETRIAEIKENEGNAAESWTREKAALNQQKTQLKQQLNNENEELNTLEDQKQTLESERESAREAKADAKAQLATERTILHEESTRCAGVHQDHDEATEEYEEAIKVLDTLVKIVEEKLQHPMSHHKVANSTQHVSA